MSEFVNFEEIYLGDTGDVARSTINDNFAKTSVSLNKKINREDITYITRWGYHGHNNLTIFPIAHDEKRVIRAEGKNLTKLEIKPNDNSTTWIDVPLGQDVNIDISDFGKDMLVKTSANELIMDGYRTIIMERILV